MGYLTYGNTTAPIRVDDELLTHLRLVIVTKLRRNESFPLTLSLGDGAVETLWVHASIPLRFVMDEEAIIDRSLVVAMMNAANSTGGLDLTRGEFAPALAGSRVLHAMSA
ncbi:hypothetical protein AB0N61_15420 [Microbacterium sp. NPDC089320]|uniref:DUF7882 family protein n=1 Tax=Microbacterium sp. NPDC089320 TaxID=3155182 RepID=UPI003440E373